MVRRTRKSGLAAKIGKRAKSSHDAHKDDTTTYSAGGDLPAGIVGGVAQLVDCKFDVFKKGDNKGEYYFYAAGVAKSPKEFEGMHVEGLRTSITEPMCDTPDRARETVEDHYGWVLNELRKLGVDTSELEFEDIEAAVEAVKEERPHFRFRTWQGKPSKQFPNPRVNSDWRGACEFEEEEGEDDVVDETTEEEEEAEEGESLDDLAAAAENEEDEKSAKAAQARLGELAEAVGIDEEAAEAIDTWPGLVEAIREASEEEEEEEVEAGEEEEEEEVEPPQKGDVFQYKPPKARKAVNVEITAIFTGKRTCNAKNLDTNKLYRSVSWDDLKDV